MDKKPAQVRVVFIDLHKVFVVRIKLVSYDIAMGGITRTLERQKNVQLSHPYLQFGKSPLIENVNAVVPAFLFIFLRQN
ncbi:transporter substrate-binding domain-containing protein [Aneurinibacillus terranovensis]|uniref:transporter substrate-binding domain-containing protein n=1 Tax=Aneurinibacillus terranovensis TaxID=278991 RepID=UPI000404F4A7|nr:transporter substrate-binding domain-containing protein [Aneurinibacillus terranovensis]